jgi:endonuclease I
MPRLAKEDAYLALQRAARRLIDSREVVDTGAEKQAYLVTDKALAAELAKLEPAERALVEAAYDDLKASVDVTGGLDFDAISAFCDAQEAKVRAADANDNGLSADEVAQLGETGKLAVQLAKALQGLRPVDAAARHVFDGVEGEALVSRVREVAGDHVELGYGVARLMLFSDVERDDAGVVGAIYSAREDRVFGIPEGEGSMNTEHVWPRSHGVQDTPAHSDLHHLYPADRDMNSKRGNLPFGEVAGAVFFESDDSRIGEDARGVKVFEPPPRVRGDVARALFYVAAVYDLPFPDGELDVLFRWHAADPVDDGERKRNRRVSRHQRNRNPFVDHPELAERIGRAGFTSDDRADLLP